MGGLNISLLAINLVVGVVNIWAWRCNLKKGQINLHNARVNADVATQNVALAANIKRLHRIAGHGEDASQAKPGKHVH